MPRVLVTGGTGFVGANLVRRLLREEHELHLLLRVGYSDWRVARLENGVQLHVADLADARGLSEIAANIRPEWVFHLAAFGAYPRQSDVTTMVRTNVLGTVNLVQVCIASGARVIVNTGSSSEYGFRSSPPKESDAGMPNSAYAVTKLAGTQLCQELARRSGIRVPTLRLYSVYGPWEDPTRLMPTLLVRGLTGSLPDLADPRNCRDFVFVDDVVDAYLQVAGTDSAADAIYNVGTGVETSIGALVDIVREMLSIEAAPRWGSYPNRGWDTHAWVADCTRIQHEVGWSPRTDLREGLRKFVEWFRYHPDYVERYRTTAGSA